MSTEHMAILDGVEPPSLQLMPAPGAHASDLAQSEAAAVRLAPGPVIVPAERRPSWTVLIALGVALGLAALVVGTLAFVKAFDVGGDGGDQPSASPLAEAISLLARPDSLRLPLRRSAGRIVLVARPGGSASLVLSGLGVARKGSIYQAWVTGPEGSWPTSAALFDGTQPLVALDAPAIPGSIVSVTLEPRGGSLAPSRTPRLVARVPRTSR